MRHTYPRWRRAGSVSVHLFGESKSILLCLVGLALGASGAQGQTLTPASPQDLLAVNPVAFAELLETARPAPVSTEAKARILSSLPPEGEVFHLNTSAREKLASLSNLLRPTQRLSVYQIAVIAVPQAAVGLHARAVVLVSEAALRLLKADELQALVAHEIGHEYIWLDYERASRAGDNSRLKELELVCDAIAIVTLQRLDMDPSRLMAGVEKISRFNRERFGTAENENAFPTLAKRRQYAQLVIQWAARASSTRSTR